MSEWSQKQRVNNINHIKESQLSIAVILSIACLGIFLFTTNFLWSPIVLFLIIIFLLHPFRRESILVKRLLIISSAIFIIWLVSIVWKALIPFAVAFLIAYLLDPFVTFLDGKKIPRWLASMVIVLAMIGIISYLAVFIFPTIFSQLNSIISKISNLVSSVTSYFSSRDFTKTLSKLGFLQDDIKSMIRQELIPAIENYLSGIMKSLLSLMMSLSGIATQIINAILIPVLSFYFLKDFPKLKKLLRSTIEKRDPKLFEDLRRINSIFHIYIGWQVVAALIVGTSCSVAFYLFGIQYPIVLGIICGFLNPIPYLGIFASMLICVTTVTVLSPENLWSQIIIIVAVINALHFINAYLLEPNIAGKRVGSHPLVLIASLFIFGYLFGFLGLLIAVPTTATLMMFFNDWRKALEAKAGA